MFTSSDAAFVLFGIDLNSARAAYAINTLYASKIVPAEEMDEVVGRASDYVSVLRSTHETREREGAECGTEWPDASFERVPGGYRITPRGKVTAHTIALILARFS